VGATASNGLLGEHEPEIDALRRHAGTVSASIWSPVFDARRARRRITTGVGDKINGIVRIRNCKQRATKVNHRSFKRHGIWRVVVHFLTGVLFLAVLTLVCFRLQINFAAMVCLYLILVAFKIRDPLNQLAVVAFGLHPRWSLIGIQTAPGETGGLYG
jgi:hypothetical protein